MDSDAWVQLAYLVLLGTAIAAGAFVRFRENLNRSLQQLVLWGLLFLGVIALYGMRDVIRPAILPHYATTTQSGEIRITRARDGHFYTTLAVNGRDVLFVIDTGASGIVLTRDDAGRLGFDTAALDYAFTANTANGVVRTARVRLDTVRLGPVEDHGLRAWVNAGDLDGSLLGMSYLSRFSKMEIAGDTMTLRR